MPDTNYGFVIVNSDSDDVGEIIDLTEELRQNPALLQEKIDEVIKKHEDAIAEDEDEELDDEEGDED